MFFNGLIKFVLSFDRYISYVNYSIMNFVCKYPIKFRQLKVKNNKYDYERFNNLQ